MPTPELCLLDAVELSRRIQTREVGCEEVMRAHLEQIDALNPRVNALVTLMPEEALAPCEIHLHIPAGAIPTPSAIKLLNKASGWMPPRSTRS